MNCVQFQIGSYRLDSQHSDMSCVLSLIGSGSVDLPQTLTPQSWILLHCKILKGNISESNQYKRKNDSPREGGNVQ